MAIDGYRALDASAFRCANGPEYLVPVQPQQRNCSCSETMRQIQTESAIQVVDIVSFTKPLAGEWHSAWHAYKLEPTKEVRAKSLAAP